MHKQVWQRARFRLGSIEFHHDHEKIILRKHKQITVSWSGECWYAKPENGVWSNGVKNVKDRCVMLELSDFKIIDVSDKG